MKQENYIKGMVMIILSAFFFACMNVSVRLAGDLPSFQKSFFRNLVAVVFAAVILLKDHEVPKVKKQYWGPLFLRCAFGTIGILCNFYAIDHLLVADASILNKLSPFFAIIFSYFILKEKINPIQVTAVLLAFAGCLFVVKPGFQNATFLPALIGVCGDRLYHGKGAGNAGSQRTGDRILFFPFLMSCDTAVCPASLYPDVSRTAGEPSHGRIVCSRRTVYDYGCLYVCASREDIYF